MRIINLLLLVFVVAALFAGGALYQDDLKEGELIDIYNLTSNMLNWEYNYTLEIPTSNDTIISSRLYNVLSKGIDFIGFTTFEVAKTGVEFGYTHPEYDYDYALGIVKLLLIIAIIAVLSPLFIPVIAIISIIFMSIYKLFKRKKDE